MIDRPTIAAHYCETSLSASEIDHPVWSEAPAIQITRKWSGDAAPLSRHAEVRIIWSEESLLVRFVCNQHEPLIVSANPQLGKKTVGLWDMDVCEIFMAPDADKPQHYFEFEAAPTGEWVDVAITLTPEGRQSDFAFHSEMTAAAIVGTGQTTIAMRIPWSDSIHKPQRGDAWRVNLFRCVGTGNERYLAWQPTHTVEPNFHVPEVFGWLEFT